MAGQMQVGPVWGDSRPHVKNNKPIHNSGWVVTMESEFCVMKGILEFDGVVFSWTGLDKNVVGIG